MRERLYIGEVAEVLGITANAVRYYHEIGLVPEPERSEGGYRLYGAREMLLLQRIRRLRSLGLSLEQVRGILGESEGEERLRSALQSQLEEISAQILELEERRERIGRALSEDDAEALSRPTASLPEELEEFVAEHSKASEGRRNFWELFRAFRWPKELLDELAKMRREEKELREAHPDAARLGDELFERFDALERVPEGSREVERLADDYFDKYLNEGLLESDPREMEMMDRFLKVFERNGVFARLLGNLAMTSFSPAQRKFLKLLQERGPEEAP